MLFMQQKLLALMTNNCEGPAQAIGYCQPGLSAAPCCAVTTSATGNLQTLAKHPGALPLRWRKDKSRAPLQVCRHAACAGRSQLLSLFEETIQGQNIPTEPEKRCKFGGPVREGKRPVKDEPDRPPKELPLLRTKLLSRDGNSSLSSDVNR